MKPHWYVFLSVWALSCQTDRQGINSLSEDDAFLLHLGPIAAKRFEIQTDDLWTEDTRDSYSGYYYLLGEYLYLQGNLAEAEQLFSFANELDPNEHVALKLIEVKLRRHNLTEAFHDLRRFVLIYPNSSKLKLIYGRLSAPVLGSEQAIALLKEAIRLDPASMEAKLSLVDRYLSDKKISEAVALAVQMTEESPDYFPAWALLARIYMLRGDIGSALDAANSAYKLQSGNFEAGLLYAYLLKKSRHTTKAAEMMAIVFGNQDSIEELMLRSIAFYRRLGPLGEIYQDLDEVSQVFTRPNLDVEMQKIFLLWELKRFNEALQALEHLYEVYPDSTPLRYLMGRAFQYSKDLKQADSWFRGIDKESLYFIPAQLQRIKMFRERQLDNVSLSLIGQLTSSRYATPQIFRLGASMFAQKERFADAIAVLERGRLRFPDHDDLYFLIGVYQEQGQQVAKCISTMKELIRKNPNHSGALNYLGYLWAEQGIKLHIAEQLILRALSLKPGDGYYLDSLGWVYYKQGLFEKALDTLQRAAAVAPNEGIISEHIGDTLRQLKRSSESKQYYQRALEAKELKEADIKRIRRKLEAPYISEDRA